METVSLSEQESRFAKIKVAVEARNAFLAEHPELQPLQDEIDETLKKFRSNDYHNRCVAIQTMLLNTWTKIVGASQELNDSWEHTSKKLKEITKELV
jgi:hypothetical protein